MPETPAFTQISRGGELFLKPVWYLSWRSSRQPTANDRDKPIWISINLSFVLIKSACGIVGQAKKGSLLMLKNKLIAVLTALLLIFAATPLQVKAATKFSDVDKHWAKNEIMYLSERNIIGGYPDGSFKPNQPITRAQASAMLIKALEIPLTENRSVAFKDVSKDSSYYPILATVNEKGILRGDNGFMRPGEKTSRAQMAAILRRAFDMPLDKQATFIDVTPAHWAYQDINGIAKQRVTGGSNGKFMPTDSVTRAQFSAFLVRALDDDMKLGRYKSYVSSKGKIVEQDGFTYFTEWDKDNGSQVIKENMRNRQT